MVACDIEIIDWFVTGDINGNEVVLSCQGGVQCVVGVNAVVDRGANCVWEDTVAEKSNH